MPPESNGPSPLTSTLLSAALSGLLSLTSCTNDPAPPRDAGVDGRVHPRDGGTVDASSPIDAGSPMDASSVMDAGSDASVAMDASARMDAGSDASAMDASTTDASGPRDAGLGAPDAFCDVLPAAERIITDASVVPGMTLEEFTAMCADLGGFIEVHPHCGGMNSCRGISYDSGTGVLTEHSCAGLNTCTGWSCVVP